MFTVERKVGRIVEIRVQALKTVADVESFMQAVRSGVAETMPARAVICADHRAVPIYPQIVADKLVALFSSINQYVERAALAVASTNRTLSLQIERIVRESYNPQRRVFYDAEPMAAWLSEILTNAEAAHVRAFLSPPVRR